MSKQFPYRVKSIAIEIFSVYDFHLIFFSNIRWQVWVCRIRAAYSKAILHIYETRKIRKMLEGGGNWTQCPMVLQKDIFKVGHQKPTNFTSCTEICENSPWAIAARLFILANVLVASHDRSSEDFIWSLARSAFSRSTFWTFKQFFGYSWSKIIEPLTISKSRWFLMGKYNFFYKRWPTISRN